VQFISQGELRLADFKQLLARSGLQSEFAEGALIVNARVIVRKQVRARAGLGLELGLGFGLGLGLWLGLGLGLGLGEG